MGGRPSMQFTRDELEHSHFRPAQLWREMRAKGGVGTRVELDITEVWKRPALTVLVLNGWVRKVGKKSSEVVYEVVNGDEPITVAPRCSHTRVKHYLTQTVIKAEKARRTGISKPMAQALFELEKDLREIREML